MIAASIISIILLIIALICIGVLIYLIIKAKKLREERAAIWYLIETGLEESDEDD